MKKLRKKRGTALVLCIMMLMSLLQNGSFSTMAEQEKAGVSYETASESDAMILDGLQENEYLEADYAEPQAVAAILESQSGQNAQAAAAQADGLVTGQGTYEAQTAGDPAIITLSSGLEVTIA